MKLSQYFLPTLKETPADAHVVSHQLMLRAGMICQESSGIYAWLPYGMRVLQKVSNVIREVQNQIGCHEIIMPLMQDADLWKESQRFDNYGKEMLRVKDRHGRDLLFGPTAEEVVTDIFRRYVKSYKDLPLCLYQIHWKFRDEIRPRFGVMRGREFLMKDGYSFDLSQEETRETYKKILTSYLEIFKRLGLVAIPVKGDPGAIGGDLSHEFQVIAPTGESKLFYDKKYDELKGRIETVDPEEIMDTYAAAEEMHDPETCGVPPDQLRESRGIEVGHIFYFGDKYTRSMKAGVVGPDGQTLYPQCGSYGIGVSRVVAALIEVNHDERGIIWPDLVAPFHIGLIGIRAHEAEVSAACEMLYKNLSSHKLDVLYDDRDETPGAKFANMDLIGVPWQVVLGPKGLKDDLIEVKCRRTGARTEMPLDRVAGFLKGKLESIL